VRLRIGIIGLGENWERRHKQALLRLADKFEIMGLYDEVAQRARIQARELGCESIEGFTALISRNDVDAIFVLSNPWFGLEPIRVACRHGKAVYHSRPFGIAEPLADEVIAEVRRSGIPFMVEFPWRLYPATIRLMELLASGLGAPQLVLCAYRSAPASPGREHDDTAASEPKHAEVAQHMCDWFRFVFGRDPIHMTSAASELASGPCRHFETLIAEFEDGAMAQTTIRRFATPTWGEAARFRPAPSFQVVAERGVAFLDMPGEVTWFDAAGRHDETLDMDRPLGEMLDDRFYRIIAHGVPPSPGITDAHWARAMVQQARQQTHNRPVEGPRDDRP
jgi:predicted dehydrogenase